MTLNQVTDRIKSLCQSHRQLRSYHYGLATEVLNDHTTKYPAVIVQDIGGNIDLAAYQRTLVFRLFFLDLVNVSFRAKENEQEAQSDMLSVAEDLIALIDQNGWNDWKLATSNPLTILAEEMNDMVAGVSIDITVTTFLEAGACDVPSEDVDFGSKAENPKNVYDKIYYATGEEGTTITTDGPGAHIPEINGKKIIAITREFGPLYRVSNIPVDSSEYTWDNSEIGLFNELRSGERLLILYRDY